MSSRSRACLASSWTSSTGRRLDAWASEPLAPDVLDSVARGLMDGLAAAHARGLIHRDLKPPNVLVDTSSGRPVPRITDFGIAKAIGGDGDLGQTRTGAVMGTPRYMAPEQLRDASRVDARADIFSLGCVLYELATGRPPFEGDDLIELLRAISDGDYPPSDTLRPDLPARVHLALDGALEIDRAVRLADVAELRAEWFGEAVERLPSAPMKPVVRPTNAKPGTWTDEGITAQGVAVDPAEAATAPDPPAPVAAPDPDPPLPPPVAAPAPAPSRWPGLVGAVLAGVVGVGVAAWWTGRDPGLPEESAPAPVERPAPEPAAIASPAPAPAPAPEPAAATVPEPTPRPEPAAVAKAAPAPDPVPAPAPPPEITPGPDATPPPEAQATEKTAAGPTPALQTASITVDGGVRVMLRDADGQSHRPGQVPPGSDRVYAFFDGVTPQDVGAVDLAPGAERTVRCMAAMQECRF